MLCTAAGPGDSSPSPFHTYHILGSSRHTVLHTSIIPATCRFFNYFCRFSPVFAVFRAFFVRTGPLAPRCARNPQQEHRNRGPGARAGRQRRPKAARGRRRTARAPRPGAPPPRAPGGAAPTGGTRARRRATAGRPARQERAEGERVHRGGYRHARAEGPTTPNPRSARGAARGAARRR